MTKITLQDDIRANLEQIRSIKGVESVVLTQRDGNPIQYGGVWLSKNEIFSVSAATSAIYNCGMQLHNKNMKYILMEGQKAKILLTPLKNSENPTLDRIIEAQGLKSSEEDFFIAITTNPLINLGGIFLKTRQTLIDIKKSLIISGENFKPPLRHFSEEELKKMYDSFNTMDDLSRTEKLSLSSMSFSDELYRNLDNVLKEFGSQTLDLLNTYITIDGGFIAAHHINDNSRTGFSLETNSSMSLSLFITADKCAWFLKKMHIDSILLECIDYFQFIHKIDNGIFSTSIAKGRQKLGLLRLLVPRYCAKIAQLLNQAKKDTAQKPAVIDFKNMFSELVL